MAHSSKKSQKDSQPRGLQLIPVDKHPYRVRDMPRTIVYMTQQQAAKRLDLIPQIQLLPLVQPATPAISIVFTYLFTQVDEAFICRVKLRTVGGTVLMPGVIVQPINTPGIDIGQWADKSLTVTIDDGVHTILGVA